MADYVNIENYSKNGKLAISRRVFEKIATDATNNVTGAKVKSREGKNKKGISKVVFDLFKPIKIAFKSNGQVDVNIDITLSKGSNASEVCLKIQEEVSNALLAYTESVPFRINIKVAEVK